MGIVQKVNDWLAEKSERIAGGNANRTAAGAYYAPNQAEQAFGGVRKPTQDAGGAAPSMDGSTGRNAPADRFSGDASDP